MDNQSGGPRVSVQFHSCHPSTPHPATLHMRSKLKRKEDLLVLKNSQPLILYFPPVFTQFLLSSQSQNKALCSSIEHSGPLGPPSALAHPLLFLWQTGCDNHRSSWRYLDLPQPHQKIPPSRLSQTWYRRAYLVLALLKIQVPRPLLKLWYSPSVFLTSVGCDTFDLGKFQNTSLGATGSQTSSGKLV